MSSQAQVAKLEDLLGRIQKNRRGTTPLGGAAKATPVPLPDARVEAEAHDAAAIDARARAPKPTPMEMALETIEPAETSMEVEITVDEGPEITIDADGEVLEDSIPTAPVETRAPVVEERPAPARIVPPREAAPVAEARAPEPVAPRPIEIAAPRAAPVARVVSRAPALEPATFGELIDRTLALRPRS